MAISFVNSYYLSETKRIWPTFFIRLFLEINTYKANTFFLCRKIAKHHQNNSLLPFVNFKNEHTFKYHWTFHIFAIFYFLIDHAYNSGCLSLVLRLSITYWSITNHWPTMLVVKVTTLTITYYVGPLQAN
jgi:hypothetical protein